MIHAMGNALKIILLIIVDVVGVVAYGILCAFINRRT
jgi:hypothetical protein